MSLRYKISANHDVREGSGKTCDLSTGGVFFSADQIMPKLDVELWIDWPFLLENVCPLYLKISGYVVRNCETGSAVKIRRYEFRTRGILVGQTPQLTQQVRTEEGAPRANRDHRIGRVDVSPFNQQRA